MPKEFPFILSNDVENISKTKDVIELLYALGFKAELDRLKIRSREQARERTGEDLTRSRSLYYSSSARSAT